MARKRNILKNRPTQILAEKGLDIPVHVDSFIVLCPPKGQNIHMDDRFKNSIKMWNQ